MPYNTMYCQWLFCYKYIKAVSKILNKKAAAQAKAHTAA